MEPPAHANVQMPNAWVKALLSSSPVTVAAAAQEKEEKEDDAACAPVRVAATWQSVAETSIWGSSFILFFMLYNGVGELSRLRGVDYTTFVMTRLDMEVLPPLTFLVVPYLLVYALPLAYVWAVYVRCGLDMPPLRRAWASFAVLIAAGYVAFVAFPVQCASLDSTWQPDTTHSVFDRMTIQFVRKGMTRFACFPSMHVANTWFQSAVFDAQRLPGRRAVKVLAYLQFAATVGTRSHYIWDLPAGWLLAECVLQCVYRPMQRAGTFARVGLLSGRALVACTAVPLALVWAIDALQRAVGWNGLARIMS